MSIYKYSSYLSCLLIAAACAKPPAEKAQTVPVTVAQATQISAPLTIDANGVVEPLQTVQVQAQVNGTLQAVAFREGDDVRAGQVLFRIDPRPYEATLRQAEATLARDQAQAGNAQRDAERYKALVAKDYVTKSQADQAQATAEALQATVQADKAAVDNAKLNLGYTTITAPISGRTGRLLVKAGNLVRANSEPLVVINQLRPIMVRFPVLQKDFPALQRRSLSASVPVRVVTADSGKIDEAGALAFLDNAVDSLTGTVTAKARFENQKDGLWPGEYVRVSVELDVQSGVTAIPSSAVLTGQDGNYVFVVKGDSAVVQPVTTGRAVGDLTTIDKGITPGERVVVDGQSRLTPNARVDVKSASAPAPGAQTATTQAGAAR
ncbi:MAG TPA: efflux RND transporter periplasmic adaptor subunit [Gemmatimonadaceae bacterium]|nr:efflux RND transporter periplasmic adaptor subunit [Gemmatimonadaceae bacterium]